MQLARGSWLVVGIIGGAILLAIIAWCVRPLPVSPLTPPSTQATDL